MLQSSGRGHTKCGELYTATRAGANSGCLHPVSLYLLPVTILVLVFLSLAHTESETGLILECDHLSICHECHVTLRDTRVTGTCCHEH